MFRVWATISGTTYYATLMDSLQWAVNPRRPESQHQMLAGNVVRQVSATVSYSQAVATYDGMATKTDAETLQYIHLNGSGSCYLFDGDNTYTATLQVEVVRMQGTKWRKVRATFGILTKA